MHIDCEEANGIKNIRELNSGLNYLYSCPKCRTKQKDRNRIGKKKGDRGKEKGEKLGKKLKLESLNEEFSYQLYTKKNAEVFEEEPEDNGKEFNNKSNHDPTEKLYDQNFTHPHIVKAKSCVIDPSTNIDNILLVHGKVRFFDFISYMQHERNIHR